MNPGHPYPLGATITPQGVNFALVAPRAGPGAATAGAIGDETFDVQAPHGG